jgi:hypothetical protein
MFGRVLGVVMRVDRVGLGVGGVIVVRSVVVVRVVVRMVVRKQRQRRIAVRVRDAMRESGQLRADEACRQPQRDRQRQPAGSTSSGSARWNRHRQAAARQAALPIVPVKADGGHAMKSSAEGRPQSGRLGHRHVCLKLHEGQYPPCVGRAAATIPSASTRYQRLPPLPSSARIMKAFGSENREP